MGTKLTRVSNGVNYGLTYELLDADISDGYLIVDFQANYPIVGAFNINNALTHANVDLDGCIITYPEDGQIKIDFSANTSGNIAEVTYIDTVADVARSLSGKYFTLNSPTTAYYVWLSTGSDVAEVTYVDTVADVARSLSGKYFTLNSPTTAYYVWLNTGTNVAQQVSVVTVADVAGSLNSTYFTIDSPTTSYYVWFNVNNLGVDPAVSNKTGIELRLATGATNVAVAQKIKTTLDMLDDFSATINGHTVVITNASVGLVTNAAADGTAATSFTITTPVIGNSASVNPNVAGKTGIEVTITPGSTNAQVATAIANVLDPLADFVATPSSNRITITNASVGINTDATAGTSGFAITIHTQGDTASIDPAISGKTGIKVSITPADNANTVASAIQVILDAMTTVFDVTVLNARVTITDHVTGGAVDATAGNSGFTATVHTQGSNDINSGDIVTVIIQRDSNV
jgi:hypothetical protein